MRIAYISADPGVPVFGSKGCSVHVQEVLRALQAEGAEITLITSRVGGDAPVDLRGVEVVTLPELPGGSSEQREKAALGHNTALRELLLRAGTFELVYERYSLWSYAAMETARSWGMPGLLEVNAPLIEEQRQHRGLANLEEAHRVARRVFTAASTLLPVSHEVGRYLTAFVPEEKIQVVANGVDPTRFGPARFGQAQKINAHHADPARFTVGFVGTLKPWHGVEVLVTAFAELQRELPEAQLLLVGSGPEEARLRASVAELGLRHVVFTGALPPSEIPGCLAAMDVAVAPYPALADFYFSPLKVYEYMAAGVAVVGSRIGQLETLIGAEQTGLLCPPGDARALAAALLRLNRDLALRKRLASAGREHVLRQHTWRGVARRILDLARLPVAS